MDKKVKELEKEEEIDVKNIYLRNFKPHQPRVGKEYQAIIPDCISAPKKKENKIINIPKEKINSNNNNKNNINKEIPIINKHSVENEKNKNEIIGHKTKENPNEREDKNDFLSNKKKKIV
jgi:hypothetical protein